MAIKHGLSDGSSLVEVVVALGIVLILSTGLVAGTAASLKGGQSSRASSSATKYAQEGLELARFSRDENWTNFLAYSGNYCIDSTSILPASSLSVGSPATSCLNNLGTYTRWLSISWSGQQATVVSTVTWYEGNTIKNSRLETRLTNWKYK